jgi:tyrosine-protein phosphatase SIW14
MSLRRAIVLGACGTLLSSIAYSAVHIRNFGEVNDHLYRGGEPSSQGLHELAAMHVSTVIDLREPGSGREAERRLAEELGMKYVNIPLPRLSAPSAAEMNRVLSLIVPDDAGRVFIHCWRGKDRTGTVIACYRIQHDGWTLAQALEEAKQNGLSRLEHAMRSFILQFKPVDLPASLAAER